MLNKILLLYVSLLLIGCVNNSDVKSNSTIIVEDKLDGVSFNKLFKALSLIPLETSKESLIKRVSKLIVKENRIFVYDHSQASLFIFNSEGHFYRKIFNRGKGPGEYISLSDFDVDVKNNHILLLDPRGKILFYSLEGDFIKELHLPMEKEGKAIHNLKKISEEILVLYSKYSNPKLHYYSIHDNKFINSEYEIPEFVIENKWATNVSSVFQSVYNTNLNDEALKFYTGMDFNIYDIKENSLSLSLKLDFGSNNYSYDILKDKNPNESDTDFFNRIKSKVAFPLDMKINNSYIFWELIFKGEMTYLVLDRQSKEQFLFPLMIDPVFFFPDEINNNEMYSAIPSFVVKESNNPKIQELGSEVLSIIKDTDNPVILKYTFKD